MGYPPANVEKATGVILPKINKDNYMDCASFRVIALMQTFSKMAESVTASRGDGGNR